jgi:hypothetical protein
VEQKNIFQRACGPNLLSAALDLDVNERTTLKCIFKKKDDRAWNGFIWFRAGTGSNVLCTLLK